ncbi:MAG TPA: phosphodiester glycosidase family protein [Polyangiaceae bacterium]
MRRLAYLAFALAGCGPTRETSPPVAPSRSAASAAAAPSAPVPPGAASASAPAPAVPAPVTAAHPSKTFPPPDIAPPFPRSTHDGDGKWVPYPEGSPFAKTVIHPHEASRFIAVILVAIDLEAVRIGYMPGTDDLGGKKVPFAPGLVPAAERQRLLAVFNGGFQPRHGRWGMKLGESTILPPRDEGCTLALYADGGVRLRSWPALADSAPAIHAFRQTPPCLVENGEVHRDLLAGRDKAWKGNTNDIVTRRRSAVGLDEKGSLLFFAIGTEASPRLLGEALRFSGAHHAAQLDINWNWTRFLSYERDRDDKLRVSASLVEGEYAKSGYFERPSDRDFFYVLRRE